VPIQSFSELRVIWPEMPETSEEEGKGDVSPIIQAHVGTLVVGAAEMGALVGRTACLAGIDPADTVKAEDAHSLDPWETVQLVHDCLAAAV